MEFRQNYVVFVQSRPAFERTLYSNRCSKVSNGLTIRVTVLKRSVTERSTGKMTNYRNEA